MTKSPQTTTHLIVRNRIQDESRWLAGFEAHRPHRIEAGLHERLILRNVDDPEECFVLFETTDPVQTRKFIDSTALGDFKTSIGITAKPEYSFLTSFKGHPFLSQITEALTKVDAMNAMGFAEMFASQGIFKFGNLAPVQGPQNIDSFVTGFFSGITFISHSIDSSWADEKTAFVRGSVSYTRKDGKIIDLPFSNFMSRDLTGAFDLWQIYMDVGPLYENS